MKNQVQNELTQLAEEITQEALQTWQTHLHAETTPLISSLEASLEALPRTKPGRIGEKFLSTIAEILQDGTRHTWNGVEISQWEALKMLPTMRWTVWKRRDIMEALLECLKHPQHKYNDDLAAETLGTIGAAAVEEWVLKELTECLKPENNGMSREYVAKALGGIGKAAAESPGVLYMLSEWLEEEGDTSQPSYVIAYSHGYVVEALGGMGEAAGTENILAKLLTFLPQEEGEGLYRDGQNKDQEKIEFFREQRREKVVETLGKMGGGVAQDWVFAKLLAGIRQTAESDLRGKIADSLGKLLEREAPDWVLKILFTWLKQSEDKDLRRHTSKALQNMGEAAAREWVMMELLALVQQTADKDLRGDAVVILGNLAKEATPDWVIKELISWLNEGYFLHHHALRALSNIGPSVAEQPGVLEALLAHLKRDRSSYADFSLMSTLGNLGERVAKHPGMLEAILTYLKGTKSWGYSVIEVLGGMGESAAECPGVLEELFLYLKPQKQGDFDTNMLHKRTAEALGRMQQDGCRFILEDRANPRFLYFATAEQLWSRDPPPREFSLRKDLLRRIQLDLKNRIPKKWHV